MGKVAVVIDNEVVTPLIEDFNLEWRQDGRSGGTLRFKDNLADAPDYEPATGQAVGIYYQGVRIWGGSIEAEILDSPKTNKRHSLRLVSLENILDRLSAGWQCYHRERFTAEPNFDILTAPGHRFQNGYRVSITSDDTLPAGLDSGVSYWVVGVNGNDLQLSQSEAGAPIDFTDGGTGPHYLWWQAGYILYDLLADKAQGEHLDLSQIQVGIPLDKRIYSGDRLSNVAEELAGVCGYHFSISEEFVVQFGPRDYSPASFSFEEPDTGVFDIKKTLTREDFANVVRLRINWQAYPPNSDNPITDGSVQEWELLYTPEDIVAVTVNGQTASFGIENVDSGLDFYWNPGEKRFVQEPTADPLEALDDLIVQYRVLGGNIVEVADEDSIAARAEVEDNGGRYEILIDAEDIVTVDAAQSRAQAILYTRNQINRILEVKVKTQMLPEIVTARPSQLVTVNVPRMGITSETYLIDTISMRVQNADDCTYELRLLSGEQVLDEIGFFKALASGGGQIRISGAASTSPAQSDGVIAYA